MSKEAGNKHTEALDVWINAKLNDREFPYKEAYWDAAQQLIEKEEGKRKKKRFIFLWIFVGLLLIALGVTATYLSLSNFYASDALAQSSSSKLTESNSNPPAESPHIANTHPDIQQLTQEVPHTETKEVTVESNIALADEEIETSSLAQPLPITKSNNMPSVASIKEKAKEKAKDSSTLQPSQQLILPLSMLDLNEPMDTINFEQLPPLEHTSSSFRSYFQLSLMGGYQQIWNTSSAQSFEFDRFSPTYGLHVTYVLNPSVSFYSGIQYVRNESFGNNINIEQREISFGLDQRVRNFQLNKLDYLEIPLFAKLNIQKRSGISLGLSNLILLQSEHIIRDRINTPFSPETQVGQEIGKGFRDGLRPFVIGVGVGYHYRMLREVSVSIRANMYPQHLFTDEVYEIDSTIPWFLGVQLSYDVFQFKLK